MFNNDITYDKKWNTPENLSALKKIESKYFDRSWCYPSCPTGWAPEVLEMLEYLDKEFGIQRNTGTMRSYYIKGNFFEHFFLSPYKELWQSLYNNFLKSSSKESWEAAYYSKPIPTRIKRVLDSFMRPIQYGVRAFKVVYVNALINKVLKPKIRLDQIKEKYGRLELYFSSPDYLDEHINTLILKTEIKLAMKGCYYPLESLWGYETSWYCGTEYHPDVYTVKQGAFVNVSKTTCRSLMKDLGINIKDIELKYQDYLNSRKNTHHEN